MSREQRGVIVSFTVLDPDHLPLKGGERMYADDVVGEVQDVVQKAVATWYATRGHELLACEPGVEGGPWRVSLRPGRRGG